MEDWLKTRLSKCLDFEIPDDMIRYILSLETSDEIDFYFKTLLSEDSEEHQIFLNDFKQRRFNTARRKKQQSDNASNKPVAKSNTVDSKKKAKYVNLFNQEGQIRSTLIPGRHHCDCEASMHKLINNCMKCGRIVCQQEGSGPCLFCGNLVCSEEEMKQIKGSTKKGDNLKKSLMEQQRPKGWEEALAERNRLLEYDRTSERRTTVIDDEADYFKTNSVWLSDAEREKLARLENELQEKKHASRLSRKVTIDFGGREIIDEPVVTVDYEDKILRDIAQTCSDTYSNTMTKKTQEMTESFDIDPNLRYPPPKYIAPAQKSKKVGKQNGNNNFDANFGEYDGIYNRVQDKELLEMQDMRNCLSMHQPWASLLVAGIKRHEGRPWYTAHRGRLWIASTAKPVDREDIKRMEQFYRHIYNDDKIIFPTQYPSGVLLGCVLVQDCLPQEEYRKQYPDGESESPFVFVCTNPEELPIKFPIKGQHKIYKVDQKIHTAAIKSLQRMARIKTEQGINV